jgi:hypothetical protein
MIRSGNDCSRVDKQLQSQSQNTDHYLDLTDVLTARSRYDTKTYSAFSPFSASFSYSASPLLTHSASSLITAGRLRHFAEITSPLTLLASSTDLKNAQQLLKEYQEGTGAGRKAWGNEENAGIWKAKQREPRTSLLSLREL